MKPPQNIFAALHIITVFCAIILAFDGCNSETPVYIPPDPGFTDEPPHVWTGPVVTIEKERFGLVEYLTEDDCSEEIANANSAAIQDAIDSLTNAGQFRLKLEKGTYCLWGLTRERENGERGKVVQIPSFVEFDLGGSTLQLAAHNWYYTSILRITLAENVKVFNGTLIGDRLTHDYTVDSDHYGGGIWVFSSMNVELSDLTISEITGDCITVGENDPISYNVTIDNITCSRARRDGIVATNVNGLIIRNSHVFDIYNDVPHISNGRTISIGAEACIAFEATGRQEISNVEIYNNVLNGNHGIEGYSTFFFSMHSGAQNIVVRDNELYGRFEWRFGKNILFKNNKVSDGSFAMGGAVNNTTSKTGFGKNFIFEGNEFHKVHIDGTQGTSSASNVDYKENLAFIGNKFYEPNPNVGPILIVNARTNAAVIDNEFMTDYTSHAGIRVAIDVPPTRGIKHAYFYANNKIPSKDKESGVGFTYPRTYSFPGVSSNTFFSLNENDVLNKSEHSAKVPVSEWDWFNESNDREAAMKWINSWKWY